MSEIPYGNLTALNHELVHGWEISARNRGTSDILYSCLFTISLCIYTAIHLNIPDPHESKRRQYLRLSKWVLAGVFGPEWVIYAAWRQWKDARDLLSHIQQHAIMSNNATLLVESMHSGLVTAAPDDERSRSPDINERSRFPKNPASAGSGQCTSCSRTQGYFRGHHVADMTYAFYAVMGGFRVDVSDMSDQVDSVVLSKDALKELISAGGYRYVKLENKTIEDRSKANSLAKLLVCCQVVWMATQCIARRASGMPLTLLELHTFAHVVCALCIYSFWFKKPLGVNEATTIQLPDELRGKIAYAVGLHHKQAIVTLTLQEPLEIHGNFTSQIRIAEQAILRAKPESRTAAPGSRHVIYADFQWSHPDCTDVLHLREDDDRKTITIHRDLNSNDNEFDMNIESNSYMSLFRAVVPLSDKDKLRWRLARSVLPSEPWLSRWRLLKTYSNTRRTTYPTDNLSEGAALSESLLGIVLVNIMTMSAHAKLLAVGLITFAYGGIHLIAWDWTFPSVVELWMWRVSGIVLVSTIPIILSLALILFAINVLNNINSVGIDIVSIGTTFLLLLIIYPLARIFLVLEVFLSLRTVPIGVYTTIPWTHYIPHL